MLKQFCFLEKILINSILLFCILPVNAQVGIGTELPDPNTILHVQSQNKGILIPTLTNSERDQIISPADGLFIFNVDEGCFNYFKSLLGRWKSLCGTPAPAEIEITSAECLKVKVFGDYEEEKALTPENYISVAVNVLKPGNYNIRAATQNGYFFSASGTFTEAGVTNIILPGTGIPKIGYDPSELGDELTLVVNNKETLCKPTVFVKKANVSFSINCVDSFVEGIYFTGESLIAENKIVLEVDAADTGYWHVYSNDLNGYSFKGDGEFITTGVQAIELQGTGTPLISGINRFTINSNSITGSSCTIDVGVKVPVSFSIVSTKVNGDYIAKQSVTGLNTMQVTVDVTNIGDYTMVTDEINGVMFSGSGSFTQTGLQAITLQASGVPQEVGNHTFSITGTSSTQGVKFYYREINVLSLGTANYTPATDLNFASTAILKYAGNFGREGIIPLVKSVNLIQGGIAQGATLKSLINYNRIDIIISAYNYLPNASSIPVLNDFVKSKKGVLLHSQETEAANFTTLANTLFDTSTISIALSTPSYTNPIKNINDPILIGPFGDLRNKYMGNDVNNALSATGLPSNALVLVSQPNGRAWAYRHNTLGIVLTGEPGAIMGTAASISLTAYPSKFSGGGIPVEKSYTGGMVSNSIFYANFIAWAIDYVNENLNINYVLP